MLPSHHSDDLVRYIEVELPQAHEVSNLEASIFSLFRILSQPVLIPKLMAEGGTKRGIIRSVSLWHMSHVPPCLVGNVADMSPRAVATPTMSAENGRRHNVDDVVTGFKAGSRIG